ncbi:HAD-IIIC family phosphatase [Enterobacter bugandensis]|uniref:HAD-IIIC family phosphatase n=4 Tax=Enterobacter TaxID=547 RepID=UPI001D0C5BA4|nr:HAD-IIIC family phosphatase [Enterobacter bugandensis]MCC2002124.1 HAD-IIIC family phosphatase [Enterobacter bugandensis]MDH2699102.1 HAD-IIIC family phosphatase [Enterobacter bugandensis]
MTNTVEAILFDLDNTLVNTNSLKEYRESTNKQPLTDEQLSTTKLYPKTKSILEKLKQSNITLGIVTNSPRKYALDILEHHNIKDYFETIVTYNEVGHDGIKPSPKGINLALSNLKLNTNNNILFIGDDAKDINASYAAGIKPLAPAWASKEFIGQMPAAMISTQCLTEELNNYNHIDLIADRCANFNTFDIDKKWLFFIPMNKDGKIGAIKKDEIDFICLGRYFSQKNKLTAKIHEQHTLSKEIYKKETDPKYVVPEYWVELLSFFVEKTPGYLFNEREMFDIITVIPAKKGNNKRLENLLTRLSRHSKNHKTSYISDLFNFSEGAQSLKTLGRDEREHEIHKNLNFNPKYASIIKNAKILIIDDVITTGSTLKGAKLLLEQMQPQRVLSIALAKTVSISEDMQFCDKCGRLMRVRRNSKTGEHFMGCTGFFETPQCRHTMSIS